MNIAQHYAMVNGAWPAALPKPSPEEVRRGAIKLYRYAFGKAPGQVRETSGNRYTWERRGVFSVNTTKGWHATIHGVSHLAHHRVNPGIRPHSKEHARIELRMVKEAVKRGWLDGSLVVIPREPVAQDASAVRTARLKRIDELKLAWERKQNRAINALAKLGKEQRRIERKAA